MALLPGGFSGYLPYARTGRGRRRKERKACKVVESIAPKKK
jgi:hypothetical protein